MPPKATKQSTEEKKSKTVTPKKQVTKRTKKEEKNPVEEEQVDQVDQVEEEHVEEKKVKKLDKTKQVQQEEQEQEQEQEQEEDDSEDLDDVINIKDVDDEENNHKWEEDEDEMLRIKASNQEKHKEFEHKESEPQEVKTFKKPQGRRFTSKYKNTDTEHQQESQTPQESQYHQQHQQHHQHQPHHFKKQKSAALNFAYKDYREITHTASNVTTVDLLRMFAKPEFDKDWDLLTQIQYKQFKLQYLKLKIVHNAKYGSTFSPVNHEHQKWLSLKIDISVLKQKWLDENAAKQTIKHIEKENLLSHDVANFVLKQYF